MKLETEGFHFGLKLVENQAPSLWHVPPLSDSRKSQSLACQGFLGIQVKRSCPLTGQLEVFTKQLLYSNTIDCV